MEQEALLVHTGEAVDVLFVFAGAERGNNDRLRFTTGEQRRTVGARQDADFRGDRANGRQITSEPVRRRRSSGLDPTRWRPKCEPPPAVRSTANPLCIGLASIRVSTRVIGSSGASKTRVIERARTTLRKAEPG